MSRGTIRLSPVMPPLRWGPPRRSHQCLHIPTLSSAPPFTQARTRRLFIAPPRPQPPFPLSGFSVSGERSTKAASRCLTVRRSAVTAIKWGFCKQKLIESPDEGSWRAEEDGAELPSSVVVVVVVSAPACGQGHMIAASGVWFSSLTWETAKR